MKQGYKDRKDESLGMRDGKESSKKQSYKSRRDESYGMKKSMGRSGDFEVKDNSHAYGVKGVNSDAEGYDLNRIKELPKNSQGYSAEAWNYKY